MGSSTTGTSGLTTMLPSSSLPNSGPITGSAPGSARVSTSPIASSTGTAGSWARRSSRGMSPAMALSSHARRLAAKLGSSKILRATGRDQERRQHGPQADHQPGEEHVVERLGLAHTEAEAPGHHRTHHRQPDGAAHRAQELDH